MLPSRESRSVYHGNSTTACPSKRRARTMAPRHSPLEKSKPTTSSRAMQDRSPLEVMRNPRGLRNSAFPIWREHSDEVSVRRVVFPNARHGVYGAEWTLARDDDIAVRRDRQIERTQFRIGDQAK